MREILFRGKRVDNGEWVYGLPRFAKYFPEVEISAIEDENGNVYEDVNPETIYQFTGLLDKNGNKIFEGDVLLCNQATEPEERGFECIFKDSAYRFVNRNYPEKHHFNLFLNEYEYIKDKLEIIGNIHDK